MPSSYVRLNENGSVGENVQFSRPARENAWPEMKLHGAETLLGSFSFPQLALTNT